MLFACVWTVLQYNVPSRKEGWWTLFFRKMRWATLAVCAPEILSLFAVMQWNSANISARQMKALGIDDWTVVHAFYANAGGFVLDTVDCPPFPVASTSLIYLVSQGRLEIPKITKEDIWDRSKADLFAKYVAFVQTGWLLCEIIGRAGQKLSVTPLELFTVAFVAPTIATQFFWAKKPQNVGAPVVIKVDWSITEVLVAAGNAAAEPYIDTPMDFVEKPVWDGWKRRPSLLHFGGLDQRPLTRTPNDYCPPPPTGKEAVFVWLTGVVYAGIHLIGWNFSFPTHAELFLWRVRSLTLLIGMAVGGMVPVLSTRSWFDFSFNLLWIWVRGAKKKTWIREWLFASLVNISYAAYCAARLVILIELCAAFRSLPADAYVEVNWSAYLPHV